MTEPLSPHFTPVALQDAYNASRQALAPNLRLSPQGDPGHGRQGFGGIPFDLGPEAAGRPDVIHLDQSAIHIPLANAKAAWAVFLHCVADMPTPYLAHFADDRPDGNWLGTPVSEYCFHYADGTSAASLIRRRFAIQQPRIGWGASAFEAVPHRKPAVYDTVMESLARGSLPATGYGYGEVRHDSGRAMENLWLYAMPNPHPDKAIARLSLTPLQEVSTVYGLSLSPLEPHPLRWLPRRKLRIPVPHDLEVTELQDLRGLDMDLGKVISARLVTDYTSQPWNPDLPDVQPVLVPDEVIVEYTGHAAARLYAIRKSGPEVIWDPVASGPSPACQVTESHQPVTLRFVEKGNGQPVSVRLHLHGMHGEYLPPKGAHRRVNPNWFEDNYGEFVNGHNQYAYVAGECVADLPLGPVFLEALCGLEIEPVRTVLEIAPETRDVTIELERKLDWRARGWVAADTHVHFLSPATARLEGAAEGVNVVNLLASQWGEMFSNVTDFDGHTVLGAREFGGDGEFLVRVGTENRMHVLGHISLLGYSGQMIHPLCTGGPNESALGDPQELSMAQWAQRCIAQGGLVISPHAPNPQCERAADIVLGLVHGIEMMTFNPYVTQIQPYGLADWYRFLNLGYHLPVVGGSDKMSASALLGGVRTYACLGQDEFTYARWMQAVKEGYTFVTIGPLVDIKVEGVSPGGRIELPATGGTVDVTWTVESLRVPVRQVEVVQGGTVIQSTDWQGEQSIAGSCTVSVTDSTWVAVRVRGCFGDYAGQIAAHSSAVMLHVADKPHFREEDAVSILAQIEGAQAYVDTLAPRPDETRYQAMRLILEQAYNRLHQRLHRQGIFHQHAPGVNDHDT